MEKEFKKIIEESKKSLEKIEKKIEDQANLGYNYRKKQHGRAT